MTKINKKKISDAQVQAVVESAEIEEIMLLFVQLRALQPVYKEDI